jgi:hypothetical protein
MVLSLFTGAFLFDFMPVIKDGKKKNIWVYGLLYTVSLLVLILFLMDVKLYSPTQLITGILKPFVDKT